jgi:TonB family protein
VRTGLSARVAGLSLLTVGLCGCASAPKRTETVSVAIPSPTAAETRGLIQGLSSKDPEIRRRSAWALAVATELQGEARHSLEPLQNDGQKSVRYAAVWALSHLSRGREERDPAEPGTAGGDWTPPKPIVSPRPDYPPEARAAKVQGTVLVEILVGEEGEVAHLAIRQSIPSLNAAAVTCVSRWKFEPARVDGAPRASVAYVPVAFRID